MIPTSQNENTNFSFDSLRNLPVPNGCAPVVPHQQNSSKFEASGLKSDYEANVALSTAASFIQLYHPRDPLYLASLPQKANLGGHLGQSFGLTPNQSRFQSGPTTLFGMHSSLESGSKQKM
jgi:hypothetical protein